MAKYKVLFHGFAYVEADNEDEAIESAQGGCSIYEETEWDEAEEIDEFYVEI